VNGYEFVQKASKRNSKINTCTLIEILEMTITTIGGEDTLQQSAESIGQRTSGMHDDHLPLSTVGMLMWHERVQQDKDVSDDQKAEFAPGLHDGKYRHCKTPKKPKGVRWRTISGRQRTPAIALTASEGAFRDSHQVCNDLGNKEPQYVFQLLQSRPARPSAEQNDHLHQHCGADVRIDVLSAYRALYWRRIVVRQVSYKGRPHLPGHP